jgi:hypothetical protein
MRHTLHIATTLLLIAGAATTHAQVYNPDNLIGKPPAPPAHQHITSNPDDLQWLWPFTRPTPIGSADNLRLDAHFQSFLSDNFKQPQTMWGPQTTHEPLPAVIPLFLSRYGTVTAEQNRYIAIDGCVPSFCAASGLLWIDLGRPHPLAVFAAVNWNPDAHTTAESTADYNLWLYPNRTLGPDELPIALTQAIAHWNIRLAAAHRLVPHIARALIIEPDGSPYALDPAMAGANAIAPQPDTTDSAPLTTNH